MKKLLLLVLVMIGGWSYLKNNLNAGQDGHVLSAGWALPNLGVGQFSDLFGLISYNLSGQGSPSARPDASIESSLTTVQTNGLGRLPANRSVNGGTLESNLAKGGNLTASPDLIKLIDPALLTTTPAGIQTLNPAGQLTLRQILAHDRANPGSIKEQLDALAKASHQ